MFNGQRFNHDMFTKLIHFTLSLLFPYIDNTLPFWDYHAGEKTVERAMNSGEIERAFRRNRKGV